MGNQGDRYGLRLPCRGCRKDCRLYTACEAKLWRTIAKEGLETAVARPLGESAAGAAPGADRPNAL